MTSAGDRSEVVSVKKGTPLVNPLHCINILQGSLFKESESTAREMRQLLQNDLQNEKGGREVNQSGRSLARVVKSQAAGG